MVRSCLVMIPVMLKFESVTQMWRNPIVRNNWNVRLRRSQHGVVLSAWLVRRDAADQ